MLSDLTLSLAIISLLPGGSTLSLGTKPRGTGGRRIKVKEDENSGTRLTTQKILVED